MKTCAPVVWHLVDAMASSGEIWGKERVIVDVASAQRASGIDARVICFTESALSEACRRSDVPVAHLEAPGRAPHRALNALAAIVSREGTAVVHTHGYKANIVARLARLGRVPMGRLVATCHGWPDETFATRIYNALDRWTAVLSDVATVPDARMQRRFPGFVRTAHVANAIPDRAPTEPARRAASRARFGWPADAFVVGTLGRYSEAKGIGDALEAARALDATCSVWAFGGSGELAERLARAGPPIACAGYVDAGAFLDGLDLYAQVSRSEGLSLALLEAMRAGLPIVATNVGATEFAVGEPHAALLVPPQDPVAFGTALARLQCDAALRARLGALARRRFEQYFRMDRQLAEFDAAYRGQN